MMDKGEEVLAGGPRNSHFTAGLSPSLPPASAFGMEPIPILSAGGSASASVDLARSPIPVYPGSITLRSHLTKSHLDASATGRVRDGVTTDGVLYRGGHVLGLELRGAMYMGARQVTRIHGNKNTSAQQPPRLMPTKNTANTPKRKLVDIGTIAPRRALDDAAPPPALAEAEKADKVQLRGPKRKS
ncbi:hypothetical protein V493_05601 [Pseudogymnoascus sp. VKM F-4281 (FW-2241)]|nr:hypothetical protein V493_05601 [Pseudogymnoascus sp. VKM F-4281 (FW-2241)]